MGLSLSRKHHAISVVLCHSILLFDLRREHSFVPTAYLHRRRAPRRSRTALLQRRRRLVLDGREHGGRLLAIGWLARAMIRGEPAIGRDQSREPRLYSVEPVWVQTMKQSYASAGKAPRRRVHSLSGIAAIAECGLPPPRSACDTSAPAHCLSGTSGSATPTGSAHVVPAHCQPWPGLSLGVSNRSRRAIPCARRSAPPLFDLEASATRSPA